MFGKEQPKVVTDKEVGDFVADLAKEGMKELSQEVLGDGMAFDSEELSGQSETED
tara:strand:- start:43 stop:207 length:165 start_codon:yes stop_codon:yes gene_type:complete